MSEPASKRPSFLADAMLGRLGKWLRLLGYDTVYINDITDEAVLSLAEAESRIILTRDTLLVQRKRCRKFIFIRSDQWHEQLKQVYKEAGLTTERALTLCAACNHPLRRVEKETVKSLVPPYVHETQTDFSQCDRCMRVYWGATHAKRIFEELKRLEKEH